MEYTLPKLLAVNVISFMLITAFVVAAKRLRFGRRTEVAMGLLGLVSWLCMQWWSWHRPDFDPTNHYPLHVCDVSSGLAVLAMLWPARGLRSLVYFVAPSAILAFIIPTGTADPGDVAFWVFWGSHIMILGMFAYEVWFRGFRPTKRDLRFAAGIACIYFVCIFLLDWQLGWNYAYVGKEGPPFPMGGWPWHAVVMYALANLTIWLLWVVGRERRSA